MSLFFQFLRDRSGNFAVLTALLMPLLLSGSVLALEFATVFVKRSQAQEASDKVAFRAADALNRNESLASITQAAKAEFAALMGLSPDEVTVTIKQGSSEPRTVELTANYTTASIDPFGAGLSTIVASSTVELSKSQTGKAATLSMYLVLDRSGSMIDMTDQIDTTKLGCVVYTYPQTTIYSGLCYLTKMEVMKRSLKVFFNKLKNAKPNTVKARTGAISFHLFADKETAMTDNPEKTFAYIDALYPAGGTNSAPAFEIAEKAFLKEDDAFMAINGAVAPKYLVYITDGVNAYPLINDKKTLESCRKIKDQGVTIYTIFLQYRFSTELGVKDAEKMVRTCASSPQNYFRASDATEFSAAIDTIGSIAVSSTSKLIR